MKTFYASPDRKSLHELSTDVEIVTNNPIIDTVLHSVSGLVAVLNAQRQIITVNHAYLDFLGIGQVETILGARPGESIGCIHAHEMPFGCGTSRHCATCGAAVSIVTSLANENPVERTCAITRETDGLTEDLYFNVRAHTMDLAGYHYVLLFIQDITREQRWANLERIFFHDIRNAVGSVLGWAELLLSDVRPELREDMKNLHRAAWRLSREIEIQYELNHGEEASLKPRYRETSVEEMVTEMTNTFRHHPLVPGKHLLFEDHTCNTRFSTDGIFFIRVMANMILNALEASADGDTIRIQARLDNDVLVFSVWNPGAIPEENQLRLFQKNFSTKEGPGRGIGTFSMKLLGEKILKGRIDFSSSLESGTEFCFRIPLSSR